MAIPFAYFMTQRARSCMTCVRSKDAQKQLARTSLNRKIFGSRDCLGPSFRDHPGVGVYTHMFDRIVKFHVNAGVILVLGTITTKRSHKPASTHD